MAIAITGKFKPKGGFALMDAEDVEYQGNRLPDFLPVPVTQAEYDAMVEAGTVNENTFYFIKEETV